MAQHNFKLMVIAGPVADQVFEINQVETIIGRDGGADIAIPSPSVSRRHARITLQGDQCFIQDLGSSNGTFLNGKRLGADIVKLNPGDQLHLGQAIKLAMHGSPMEVSEGETKISSANPNEMLQTRIDESIDLPLESEPPTLAVILAGAAPHVYKLEKDFISIGRADDNDIVIPSQVISRYHARLERIVDRYQFIVLPEATNPVSYEGRELRAPAKLRHGDKLTIGEVDSKLMVTLEFYKSAETGATLEARNIHFEGKSKLQIGRDANNDVVLNAPNVSRYHAQIEKVGQRYRVRDLNSSNGTFVNYQRIEGETWLKPNDSIKIGPYRFVLGQDQLAQIDDTSGLQVSAVGLNKWVRKDLNILQNISLIFQPREFIVVVGQSGGGKSTLVDAIAGYRPATHGQVLVNGINIYQNFEAVRNDIGFVPQRDIIHMELTVYQALDYAARLRMPPDTSKAERHQRIMEVLDDLDLAHRKDVQISGLSGGQQKRVSIGVELLTSPGLFFLDEPTSGLDPGTETALMQLMRRLADQGRTIILVTHATKNVMLADKVIFLARGGYLAWFGPPDEALKYFDHYRNERERHTEGMEFDQIYAILDNPQKGTAEEWAQRYQQHRAYQQYIVQPLVQNQQAGMLTGPAHRVAQPTEKKYRKQVSALRQFQILSARNLKILTRDRSSLILMLLAAPLVGCLDLLLGPLMGRNLFDYFDGDIANASVTLFLLTIYSMLVGGLSQMREIVKEGEIYKRERLVNLKILPYVTSKVWIAALLALYHALAYTILRYVAFNMPGGVQEFIMIYITLFLAVAAGMMLGLLASALAPQASSAPLIMILLIVPQIVLSGALAPLPSVASAPASTRWTFDALMAITGGGSDVAADPCWALPEDVRDAMTLEDKANLGCSCMGENVFDPQSCSFPGIGQYYDPAVDQPKPVEPISPGDPPAEPEFPPAPQPPIDQSDNFAMSEYLTALGDYQAETDRLQEDYRAQVALFEAENEVYKAEITDYQEALSEWQIARQSSISAAEGIIGGMREDFGKTFVDKNDNAGFIRFVGTTWLAQIILITLMFSMILVLMKRKDVN